ncbi:MAG: sulfatase [Candidatus Hydrogenedentes bacterium]|nr:sulfatase [Candidatus Hydrogenedentota bacterium]
MRQIGSVSIFLPALFAVFLALPGYSDSGFYASYRFDDKLGEATVVEGAEPPKDVGGLRLAFTESSAAEWSSLSGKSRVGVTGSTLTFSSDGGDCLVSPGGLNVQAPATDSIQIKMRVTGTADVRLYWPLPPSREPDPYRFIRIGVPQQGEMIAYNLRVSALRGWDSVIDRVLLSVASPAQVEVEYIQFVAGGAAFVEKGGRYACSVDNRVRPSLYTRCPGRFCYRVKAPDRAVFSAGLAVAKEGQPVTFTVLAETDGKSEVLCSRTVSDPAKWEEMEVDLSKYAGRQVNLSLASRCDFGGQVGFWGNPLMFQRAAPESGRTGPPNVVLYVVDCLRADHLETGGYPRRTAPHLADFARQGVVFDHCYAQETWTKPSIASIMTGVDQLRHNVKQQGRLVPSDLKMLPELLRSIGYETCVVTENPNTPPESAEEGIYSEVDLVCRNALTGGLKWHDLPPLTHEAVSGFLRRNVDKPVFLYVHTMELHETECSRPPCDQHVYDPVEPYRSMWKSPGGQTSMDLYDGGISCADDNFQRVLETIDLLGLAENTIVIVTGDHGEGFGEHEGQRSHPCKPYDEMIHVPLLVRFPKGLAGGRTVTANVQLLDVAPTLFDLLGLGECGQFEGRSLVPLAEGGAAADFENRLVFSTYSNFTSAIRGDWKLMYDHSTRNRKLFNIRKDPGESADLALSERPIAEELEKELLAHVARQAELHEALMKRKDETAVGIDPQVQEQLESLGYLDGGN